MRSYEVQIARLIKSNLEVNELQAKVRELEQKLIQSKTQLANFLNENYE